MIKVWNMKEEKWVELKSWMRYCPDIWCNPLKYSDEDWEDLIMKERNHEQIKK